MRIEYLRRRAVEAGINWVGKKKRVLEKELDEYMLKKKENLYRKENFKMQDEKINKMQKLVAEINALFCYEGEDAYHESSIDANYLMESIKESADQFEVDDFTGDDCFSKEAIKTIKELGFTLPEGVEEPEPMPEPVEDVEEAPVPKEKDIQAQEQEVIAKADKVIKEKTSRPNGKRDYNSRKDIKRRAKELYSLGVKDKREFRSKLIEEFGQDKASKQFIYSLVSCVGNVKYYRSYGFKEQVIWE